MKLTTLLRSTTAVLALASILTPAISLAHEGHDHTAGLLPEAPHGGVLKEASKMNLELVTSGQEIKLYPLSKTGVAVESKDVQLTATVQPPKQKKASKLDLKANGDHYVGKVDLKGAYRYELKVEASAKGQKETFTFQVEPQG